MVVVVSDTTPLHYLILIGRESVLEKIYRQVIVPPAVLQELGQPALGMCGPHRVGHRQNPLPQDPFQFPDRLSSAASPPGQSFKPHQRCLQARGNLAAKKRKQRKMKTDATFSRLWD